MTIKAAQIVAKLQGNRFVYCCQAWQRAAAMIALRIPITSPPVDEATFDPRWMEGKPLLIFKLHGEENDPNWYGMGAHGQRTIALTPALVEVADLANAIVIAIVCHGLGGPMEYAFYRAGARAVFGSHAEVRGRETKIGEADVLAHSLIRHLAYTTKDLADVLAQAKWEYLAGKETPTEHDLFTVENFVVSLAADAAGREGEHA
jgi:hypothetical protein